MLQVIAYRKLYTENQKFNSYSLLRTTYFITILLHIKMCVYIKHLQIFQDTINKLVNLVFNAKINK